MLPALASYAQEDSLLAEEHVHTLIPSTNTEHISARLCTRLWAQPVNQCPVRCPLSQISGQVTTHTYTHRNFLTAFYPKLILNLCFLSILSLDHLRHSTLRAADPQVWESLVCSDVLPDVQSSCILLPQFPSNTTRHSFIYLVKKIGSDHLLCARLWE